jgi:hypothetical protein
MYPGNPSVGKTSKGGALLASEEWQVTLESIIFLTAENELNLQQYGPAKIRLYGPAEYGLYGPVLYSLYGLLLGPLLLRNSASKGP